MNMSPLRSEKKIGLTPEEEIRFFEAVRQTKNLRSMALWFVISEVGLRIAEALSLTVGKVREKEQFYITVKGGAQKLVCISKPMQKDIVKYLEQRKGAGQLEDSSPLFLSRNGGRLSVRQAEREFLSLLQKAKINNPQYEEERQGKDAKTKRGEPIKYMRNGKEISFTRNRFAKTVHCLRHTVGTLAYRQGGAKLAQKILNHRDSNTTMNFYVDPQPHEIRSWVEERGKSIREK